MTDNEKASKDQTPTPEPTPAPSGKTGWSKAAKRRAAQRYGRSRSGRLRGPVSYGDASEIYDND